jgi:hypothetical protein
MEWQAGRMAMRRPPEKKPVAMQIGARSTGARSTGGQWARGLWAGGLLMESPQAVPERPAMTGRDDVMVPIAPA